MDDCFKLLLVVLLVGCHSAVPPTAPQLPPEVAVAVATTSKLVEFREFTGRTAAVDAVELRARVSGYVLQTPRTKTNDASMPAVTVEEGKLVKKGDLLFVIDDKPYQLALKQAVGALTATEAKLQQANNELTRSESLVNSNSISRTDYDQAVASVAELRGQIESLKATVARNQLDLEYTQVRSPIDGLLGQTSVTAGNLVVADSTVLTTVVAVNPIYVNFDVDEQSVLDYRTRMLDGKVKNAREGKIAVRLGLANNDGFPQEGFIDFVNNVTDPGTGNTRVRATFDNNTGILSPGLFARIQVPFSAEYQAVLVPTKSIAMDQQGRHVMVVADDNRVSRRAVNLGPIEGDMTVIREGVKAGEQVVTAGLQKIQPGAEVRVSSSPSHREDNKPTGDDLGDLK
ncbi:MAG: efflux RND transporter periplasmic adaptor subunit [Pirellulaceae bacterium]|nr:efflux RND transporter periplasmic adaptor subunit [Pirellulaceae bacterium]